MKKIIATALTLICVLGTFGCASRPDGTTDLIELNEVSAFVSEKGYTGEDFKDKLVGQFNEDIIHSWGEPDGKLSGFWGDRWYLDDDKTRFITLYYDEKGYVEEIVVSDNEKTENETVSFHDRTINKSDLSEETLAWLERYNALSSEEQLAISSIPPDLYELCGYGEAEDVEVNGPTE